jgi:WD40 repeat protein
VHTKDGYEDTLRRLTNQPGAVKPELGKMRSLPPGERKSEGAVGGEVALSNLPDAKPFARSVFAVALTPDGRRALSLSGDKMLRLWDPESGQTLRTLEGHTGSVHAVTLAEVDGEPVVVSGSWDATVRVWDARTGRPCGKPLTGHTGSVFAVALSHTFPRGSIRSPESIARWTITELRWPLLADFLAARPQSITVSASGKLPSTDDVGKPHELEKLYDDEEVKAVLGYGSEGAMALDEQSIRQIVGTL